jgi:1,2-diacylglycerol 3-alpha-glucosyltransferase
MKIVHLCLSNYYIDDFSYQENLLPKYHVLQGHNVTVIASLVSFDSNGKPCLLDAESIKMTKDGYKVIRVDYKRPFYQLNKFVRFYKGIYSLLENETPDLIFVHDFSFMDIGKVIKYVALNKKVKLYADCHTDFINSAQTWISRNIFHKIVWRYYAKKMSPFVSKFYGTTPLRCDFLREVYSIDSRKIELLAMGIDDEQIKNKKRDKIREQHISEFKFSEKDFVIVTGGKIDIKKNIHLLMQAVLNINREDIKLVVFGTVSSEINSLFNNLLITNSVLFIGWQNPDKILDYFIFADLVVFPGTHSVLWEQAVGVGVPCLFKYWKGMTHVDLGGNCEFLYEDKIEEIQMKLLSIIHNPDRYVLMKKNAIEKGLRSFSYSYIAEKAISC